MKRGDSPETELTNARTSERSWPCRLTTGGLVWIVESIRENGQRVLVDDNGRRYRDENGFLVSLDKEV